MNRRFLVYLGSEYSTESLPGTSSGGTPSYSLIDWLEPIHESVVSDGEIGALQLIASKHPEEVVPLVPLHRPLKLVDHDHDDAVVFEGTVVKLHTIWGGSEEKTEIIAYNNGDYLLHRIAVHGQHRRSHSLEETTWDNPPADPSAAYGISKTDVIRIDTPCVFNPAGQPNRTSQKYFLNDSTANGGVYLFDVPGRSQKSEAASSGSSGGVFTVESKPWTLGQAVAYLLTFYNTTWSIDPTSFGDVPLGIFAEKGDPVISETNIEGKSLLESLQLLCSPYNYGFYVSPTLDGTSGKHRIYFYFKTASQFSSTVRLSPRKTNAGDSDANLIHADLLYDAASVVNTIRSYGDRISVTTLAHTDPPTPAGSDPPVLKLYKGWLDKDLIWATNADATVNSFDTTFRKNYCHPDLISYGIDGTPYGVGRMWVVNLGERADKQLEDLGVDLANGVFKDRNSIDPRRCEKPDFYNRNSPGGLLHEEDIQVEMSFDGGKNWDIVERHWYRVLSDHVGIVFSDPMLEKLGIKFKNNDAASGKTYWQALKDNKLQIRILCSIKSDERVSAIRSNVGDAVPLATERIFWNPNGYHKVIVNPQANSSAYYTKFQPLVPAQDDSSQLTTLTNLQASYTDRLFHSGQMTVVLDEFNEYHPGMQISQIENRVTFSPAPIVLRTIYDFANRHVHLVLDSHHVRSVLQARPEFDRSREEARLGIRNLTPVPGAKQVPFLPGDSESLKTFIREGGSL